MVNVRRGEGERSEGGEERKEGDGGKMEVVLRGEGKERCGRGRGEGGEGRGGEGREKEGKGG